MRHAGRIDVVLSKIDWFEFIKSNTDLEGSKAVNIANRIINNVHVIAVKWRANPQMRLGQILIDNWYAPDSGKLSTVEEDEWLFKNHYCYFEDIKFWNNTLLKNLDDARICAILDYHEDNNMGLNPDYKKYFQKRIKELVYE